MIIAIIDVVFAIIFKIIDGCWVNLVLKVVLLVLLLNYLFSLFFEYLDLVLLLGLHLVVLSMMSELKVETLLPQKGVVRELLSLVS